MNSSIRNFVFVISALLITGCHKETPECKCNQNNDSGDYLVFGSFYGECLGETCVETFKLTASEVFEDTNDHYPCEAPYNFVGLTEEKFNQVNGLMARIPDALLAVNDTTFGCPDCVDQGGILIKYSTGGTEKTWKMDMQEDVVPGYLHSFLDSVKVKISTLSE